MHHQYAVGAVKGMCWVVRHHQHTGTQIDQVAHPRQDGLLVTKIQRRGRLVHHQYARLLSQGTGNQHQLLLATGEMGIGALGQMFDTQLAKRAPGYLPVLGGNPGNPVDVGRTAKQHNVRNLKRERRRMHLRYIGKMLRQFPLAESRGVLAVNMHLAANGTQQPEYGFQRRGLAAAVGADDADELTSPHREVDSVDNLLLIIAC